MSRGHKVGAIFYTLWGIVHVIGGGALLKAGLSSPAGALALLATTTPREQLPAIDSPLVGSILAYYGWLLVVFGALALVIAYRLNWRNDRAGYWINLGMVGGVDLGLLLLLLIPGYIPWRDGMIGLSLFALAAVFSTLGRLAGPATESG